MTKGKIGRAFKGCQGLEVVVTRNTEGPSEGDNEPLFQQACNASGMSLCKNSQALEPALEFTRPMG